MTSRGNAGVALIGMLGGETIANVATNILPPLGGIGSDGRSAARRCLKQGYTVWKRISLRPN
eukprot:1150659-Prorocentrum_lima.AAC.1